MYLHFLYVCNTQLGFLFHLIRFGKCDALKYDSLESTTAQG